ncbi:hypothetical protein DFH09DRAFT_943414, partial [Mycena vulgaris]
QVLAAMMDNASNNDTLVAALEVKFKSVGITWWDALEARMRCFPHTTHLAVLKLLEAIGAVERPDPKKRGVYQDSVTAGVDREDDGDGEDGGDGDDEDEPDDELYNLQAVARVCSSNLSFIIWISYQNPMSPVAPHHPGS